MSEQAHASFGLKPKALWMLVGFALTAICSQLALGRLGFAAIEAGYNRPARSTLYAYATAPETPDVLLIGSSRVLYGLHSAVIEQRFEREHDLQVSVFKVAFGALRPYFLSRVIEDLVRVRPPQRLLVLGIEERYFLRAVVDATWAVERGLPNAERDGELVPGDWDMDERMAADPGALSGLKGLWFLPWMLRPKVRQETAFQRANDGEYLSLEQRKGYDDRMRRWIEQRGERPHTRERTRWEWSRENSDGEGLDRIFELIEDLECEVVFVNMPIEPEFRTSEIAGVTRRFRSEIVPLIEARGYRYFDLNEGGYDLVDADFMDRDHLFWSGCRKTSTRLVDEVLAPLMGVE